MSMMSYIILSLFTLVAVSCGETADQLPGLQSNESSSGELVGGNGQGRSSDAQVNTGQNSQYSGTSQNSFGSSFDDANRFGNIGSSSPTNSQIGGTVSASGDSETPEETEELLPRDSVTGTWRYGKLPSTKGQSECNQHGPLCASGATRFIRGGVFGENRCLCN